LLLEYANSIDNRKIRLFCWGPRAAGSVNAEAVAAGRGAIVVEFCGFGLMGRLAALEKTRAARRTLRGLLGRLRRKGLVFSAQGEWREEVRGSERLTQKLLIRIVVAGRLVGRRRCGSE
jgi:hypothetical protein